MTSILAACAAIVAAFWAVVILDRKRSWPREMRLDLCEPESAEDPARPSPSRRDTVVIIPARNERETVEVALPSLLAQADDFARLIYVDDRSDDGTGDVARKIADATPGATRVDVLRAPERRSGWTGKLHALEHGLEHARAVCDPLPEWILLTDADIHHAPGSIRALRALADRASRDTVSIMARLRAENVWERLLIPPFVAFFQLLYPFRRVADDRSRVAAGAGGCVLVRREALERAGGLEAVRGAVIDDVSLARAIKRAGGRLWLGLSSGITSVRGYDGPGEIVRMIARTAYEQLGRNVLVLLATLLGILLVLVSPPIVLALSIARLELFPALAALFAWGAQTAMLHPAVRHHGVGRAWALTLPFASVFYLYATALSAWRDWRGAGVQWRGRVLHDETDASAARTADRDEPCSPAMDADGEPMLERERKR
ncbi:MAG TPA: glycosyltransferase [Planctomycetota bacterium]|nr:glycosyltransferase [Planctomycetota bacterium]